VQRLAERWELPAPVQAVDGGTLGLSLLPLVDSADELLLVDAIRGDGPAGTLVRLEDREVGPAVYERLSVHQIGVADLLSGAALIGRYPRRVVLLGVVPASLELGTEPTPAVAASIDGLVDAVVAELGAMGHVCRRREPLA
jgi:hydrogenase maturation protease